MKPIETMKSVNQKNQPTRRVWCAVCGERELGVALGSATKLAGHFHNYTYKTSIS